MRRRSKRLKQNEPANASARDAGHRLIGDYSYGPIGCRGRGRILRFRRNDTQYFRGYQIQGAYTGIGAVAAQDQSKTCGHGASHALFVFGCAVFVLVGGAKTDTSTFGECTYVLAWWATAP